MATDDKSNSKESGGYMAVLHDIEEKLYGPNSPFDGKTKVFLFIRHKLIRDWQQVKGISKRDIISATGIENRRLLDRVLKRLEADHMILSHKSKTGMVWNETQYALHPKTFGYDTLWKGEGAAKNSKKNSKFKLVDNCKIISITIKKGSAQKAPWGSASEAVTGSAQEAPQNDFKFSELLDKIAQKNPSLKEPDKRTLSEESKFFVDKSESGKKGKQLDNIEDEKKRQLLAAKKAGIL